MIKKLREFASDGGKTFLYLIGGSLIVAGVMLLFLVFTEPYFLIPVVGSLFLGILLCYCAATCDEPEETVSLVEKRAELTDEDLVWDPTPNFGRKESASEKAANTAREGAPTQLFDVPHYLLDDDADDFLISGDRELYDRFCRLKELYEDDLITEEEYEEKKAELLAEL